MINTWAAAVTLIWKRKEINKKKNRPENDLKESKLDDGDTLCWDRNIYIKEYGLTKNTFWKILDTESLILPVQEWSVTERNLRLHRWLQWLGRKIEVWWLLLDLEKSYYYYYYSLLFLFTSQWAIAAISSPAPLLPASSSSPLLLELVQRAPWPGGGLCRG